MEIGKYIDGCTEQSMQFLGSYLLNVLLNKKHTQTKRYNKNNTWLHQTVYYLITDPIGCNLKKFVLTKVNIKTEKQNKTLDNRKEYITNKKTEIWESMPKLHEGNDLK